MMKDNIRKHDFSECKGIWIPAAILFNNDLSWLEKHLVIDIHNLETDDRGCFKSNAAFAAFHNVGISSIEKALTRLRRLDFIYTESYDGRTRAVRVNDHKYFGVRPGKNSGSQPEETTGLSRKNFRAKWDEKSVHDIPGEQHVAPREAGKEKEESSSNSKVFRSSPSARSRAADAAGIVPSEQSGAAAPEPPHPSTLNPGTLAEQFVRFFQTWSTTVGANGVVNKKERQALTEFFADNPGITPRELTAIMLAAWISVPLKKSGETREPHWFCLNKSRRVKTLLECLPDIQDELGWKSDVEQVEKVYRIAEKRFITQGAKPA